MANIHIKTKWSDDGKYVTLSKDDWEKVLLSLEKFGSVNQIFLPIPIQTRLEHNEHFVKVITAEKDKG